MVEKTCWLSFTSNLNTALCFERFFKKLSKVSIKKTHLTHKSGWLLTNNELRISYIFPYLETENKLGTFFNLRNLEKLKSFSDLNSWVRIVNIYIPPKRPLNSTYFLFIPSQFSPRS